MSEKLIGHCPHCGNEIEIPAHLQEFSCLYCGARSYTDLLRAQADFRPEDLQELASQLPQTLKERGELYKHITKKDYESYFAAYEAQYSGLLRRVDMMVHASPNGLASASAQVCDIFLETMEKDLQEDKRYGNKRSRDSVLFEIKVVLALFLTPLVRKLHLTMAEDFCRELHERWMEKYPGENWTPGDYEVITGSFRKGHLCFITTAVCAAEGKPDDCPELCSLRAFRDGWLRENGGEKWIEEYYAIAPTLVTLMDYCEDRASCYSSIRRQWIDPCLELLSKGEGEACKDTYINMVRSLQRRYRQ